MLFVYPVSDMVSADQRAKFNSIQQRRRVGDLGYNAGNKDEEVTERSYHESICSDTFEVGVKNVGKTNGTGETDIVMKIVEGADDV